MEALNLCHERRYAVVALAPTPVAGFGAALAKSLGGERIRLVVRVQGHTASKALLVRHAPVRFRALDWAEAFVIGRADLVLPMGKFTSGLALAKGAKPGATIVLPFPVSWLNAATVSPLLERPCVLFAGRLEKEKGVHILLRAMLSVREMIPGVCLRIAGNGSERSALEALAGRLGLNGMVSFLGWLDGDSLRDAYTQSWCVVLPSLWAEGWCW